MPDFTSALYLGFTHPSASLPSWGALTLGRPAALEEPTGGRTLTRELTQLIGGEAGILYPSTLHLFRDVFQVTAPKGTVILFDAASYAIARWAAEGAAVKGIPIETFPHRDVIALERRVRQARRAGQRPLIVADGLCPSCGRPAPLPALARLAADAGGRLVIDDTQALGVLGREPSVTAPLGTGGGGTLAWHGLSEDMRLPPVLEELGENLLRACPHQGILFTAGEEDTQAAWYLRFSRGLRPDLMIIPFDRWRGDSVLRNRALRELKTRDPSLRALSQSRAVCASMGFERPPDERAVKWNRRPLVWVTGKETKADRVPAQDFVFAALKLAVDEHETWTEPVTALYRRAASNVGGLCKAFDTFGLSAEVGCR